jgi:1-acyl-sn-glycerol-3-phosphate acyltransferase
MTWYGFARAIVLPLCRLVFRVQVHGREHVPASGVYILAPTHRSILDVPFAAFATKRRIRFMAKREIFTTNIGRKVFSAMGAIEVDRGATDRGALRASKAALEAGEPLGIFPEGTRRTGPVVEDLYDGCAYLALKLGVPMVPVGIGGSEQIMPTGRILPRLRRVVVVIGEPIEPPATTGVRRRSEVGDLTETLRTRLQESFDEACGRRARPGERSGVVVERREDR